MKVLLMENFKIHLKMTIEDNFARTIVRRNREGNQKKRTIKQRWQSGRTKRTNKWRWQRWQTNKDEPNEYDEKPRWQANEDNKRQWQMKTMNENDKWRFAVYFPMSPSCHFFFSFFSDDLSFSTPVLLWLPASSATDLAFASLSVVVSVFAALVSEVNHISI